MSRHTLMDMNGKQHKAMNIFVVFASLAFFASVEAGTDCSQIKQLFSQCFTSRNISSEYLKPSTLLKACTDNTAYREATKCVNNLITDCPNTSEFVFFFNEEMDLVQRDTCFEPNTQQDCLLQEMSDASELKQCMESNYPGFNQPDLTEREELCLITKASVYCHSTKVKACDMNTGAAYVHVMRLLISRACTNPIG